MDVIQDVCQRVIIIKEGRIVADDTVDRLLALFRTRAYRIVLSDGLSSDIRRQLSESVAGLAFEPRGQQTELNFSLPSSEGLYQVIDLIRQGGALIETITQKEPDLEEAFLRVIRDGFGRQEQAAEEAEQPASPGEQDGAGI
jgi:ABC-2 type transport system ATP-binding protein